MWESVARLGVRMEREPSQIGMASGRRSSWRWLKTHTQHSLDPDIIIISLLEQISAEPTVDERVEIVYFYWNHTRSGLTDRHRARLNWNHFVARCCFPARFFFSFSLSATDFFLLLYNDFFTLTPAVDLLFFSPSFELNVREHASKWAEMASW